MINDWGKSEFKKKYLPMGTLLCSLPVLFPCFHSKSTWAFTSEFLNFLDSGNISCEHLQENGVQIEILPLGYNPANSQQDLFNLQPSARPTWNYWWHISDDQDGEARWRGASFFFFYKRTIELVTRLEMPCQLGPHGHRAQLLKGNKTVQLGPPSNLSQG